MPRNMEVMLHAESEDALRDKIEQYMQQYHPAGYYTRVTRTSYDEGKEVYTATLSRWDSCD
jgi:hypothetical protein